MIRKKRLYLIGVFLWMLELMPLSAQIDLSVGAIPDSLKKNAYSVLRFDNEIVELSSLKSGIRKDSYAITVLNEKGEDNADFKFSGDDFNVLKSFTAKLYNADGTLLKKFSKSDLVTSEYSENLASDNKIYLLNFKAPSIPFTIQYDYEVSKKNGILNFGAFYPIGTYYHSVQHYVYELRLPESIVPRIKSFNLMKDPEVNTLKGITSYVWEIENQKSLESEPLDPPLDECVPFVIIAPNEFIYDGTPGSVSSWNDLGKWSYNLTVGRDLIPETLKAKLLEKTQNAKTDREKVQIIYNFLGETTRYVSIQLGIGGYQPMSAQEVYKTGFGDCKALTNYMKAMLSVVGIPSNYCTIRLDDADKDLLTDFPDFHQMNHVILLVPLENDSLWLECTNPKVPFGFIHNGIAGHDALVCSENGGVIQKLKDYPDSLNLEQYVAHVNLQADGRANVQMKKNCSVKIYDNYSWFPMADGPKQSENLRQDIQLPNVDLVNYHVSENKMVLPSILIDYSWKTSLYGSKTGNRLFLPVNVFRSGYDQLRKANRIHDIYINTGFRDADSIFIQIPDGFDVEAMPASITENTKYGRFKSEITLSGNSLIITQIADVYSGKYKANEFQEFMAFLNKISASYKGKIILRKKVA